MSSLAFEIAATIEEVQMAKPPKPTRQGDLFNFFETPVDPRKGTIKCLRCDVKFESSDTKTNRICAVCKNQEIWRYGSDS